MRTAFLNCLSAACIIAATPAFSQAVPAVDAEPQSASPAMWRVSDADSEVFILGTFHILPAGLDWRTHAFEAALEKADTVWFEAEVDTGAAQQKTLQIIMADGFNAQGQKLTSLLEPADAARLRDIVGGLNLPMAAIDPMRPWQAFLTLSVQFVVAQGFDPASGVDSTLLREARTRGKSLRFFETVEQQLGFFSTLPANAELDLLVLTIRDWDEQTADFDDMFAAWQTGDMPAIDAMMNEVMRDKTPLVYDVLVAKRNAAWAETIAKEMDGAGVTLVAVGAGHLAGEDSVQALLAAKGLQVERYGDATDAGDSQNPTSPADEGAPSDGAANASDPIADMIEDVRE